MEIKDQKLANGGRSKSRFKWFWSNFLSLLLTYCGSAQQQYKPDQMAVSINRAREILASSDRLSDFEKKEISAASPKWTMYILSGDYAQFSFSWIIGKKRIMLFGTGNRYSLEGAEIDISDLEKKP